MDADEHGSDSLKILFNDMEHELETGSVLNCSFEILNEMGHGLLEKPYENALCVEFGLRGIPYLQ
jgi:hypothetical protein